MSMSERNVAILPGSELRESGPKLVVVGSVPARSRVRHVTIDQARQEGALLARERRRQAGYDVSGLLFSLGASLRNPFITKATKGWLVVSALEAIGDDRIRAEAAARLVRAIDPISLPNLGRDGVEALRQAVALSGNHREALEMLDAELSERGKTSYRDVIHGVLLVGDGISQATMNTASFYLERMLRHPEVAAALRGHEVVIATGGETHDGLHAEHPRNTVIQEHLLARRGDLPGSACREVSHEFAHAIKTHYLASLPSSDERLAALLPSRLSPHKNWTATELLEVAFDCRKTGKLDAPPIEDAFASTNADEWFAQAAVAFLAEPASAPESPLDAQWLYDRDPALFNLLRSLFGETPQAIERHRENGA
jgi:hypothetical protein